MHKLSFIKNYLGKEPKHMHTQKFKHDFPWMITCFLKPGTSVQLPDNLFYSYQRHIGNSILEKGSWNFNVVTEEKERI